MTKVKKLVSKVTIINMYYSFIYPYLTYGSIFWGNNYYYSTFTHCTNDLYHMTLGYDATTSLTSLSWCNSRGVNSTHHCHYTMALADSKFDDFCCSVFNLNNKKVNALIARELSGFTCTRSLTMNSKFFNTALGGLVQY